MNDMIKFAINSVIAASIIAVALSVAIVVTEDDDSSFSTEKVFVEPQGKFVVAVDN